MEPRVGAAVAGGPDDGPDACPPRSSAAGARRRHGPRRERLAAGRARRRARCDREAVDPVAGAASSLRVGGRRGRDQVVGEARRGRPSTPRAAPRDADARRCEDGQVERRVVGPPTSCSDGWRAPRRGRRPVGRLGEHAHRRRATTRCRARDSRRGSRVWRPTASVTGGRRGAISSASWTPEADAPTTSTPPGGSCAGIAVAVGHELDDVAAAGPPRPAARTGRRSGRSRSRRSRARTRRRWSSTR